MINTPLADFFQPLLGGFVSSSAVVLWSLLAPIGALIFYKPRQALYWLAAYLVLVVISSLAQPYLPSDNNLPSYVRLAFFLMNLLNFRIGINSGPLVAGVIGTRKFVYN